METAARKRRDTSVVRHNVAGLKFGKLTAIRRAGRVPSGTLWQCRCECGRERDVPLCKLTGGDVVSCGCANRPRPVGSKPRRTRPYERELAHLWRNMMARCYRKTDKDYAKFGGRGIAVAGPWREFEQFYAEMAGGYTPGARLTRADRDGDYTPENCSWQVR